MVITMKKNKTGMIFLLVLSLVLAFAAPADGVAKAKRPSLNKKKLTLKVGKTSRLRLKNNRKKVKWSTANKKIATVSKKGIVRGRKTGKTRITAKAGGKKYTCRVFVIKRNQTAKPNPSPSEQPATEQGYAGEVLRLVNVERAKYGLSPLVLDQKLCSAADLRAKEITQVFSHTRPDGRECFTVLDESGIHYRKAAENIARGQSSAEAVVAGWMNSPGHRANILGPDFKALGVGYTGASSPCWVQLFTDRVSDSSDKPTSTAPSNKPAPSTVPADKPGTSNTPGTGQITTPPVDTNAYPNEVLKLVNEERAKVGAQPLVLDASLCEAATVRAQEIITLFSHTRPDGTSCFSVLADMGISYMTCGENIAAGYATPEAVVSSWMDSEGHRENILNASYGKLGVGFVKTDAGYRYYWVQLFTN